MAAVTENDDDIISGINVTPLVDVVLVLLIIFIVTASFLLKSAIPVELPAAASAEQAPGGLLTVVVAKDGAVLVNGQAGGIEALPKAVADVAAVRGGRVDSVEAFVSADVGAPYGRFAEVVDRLRVEGVVKVALDTQPREVVP